MIFGFTILGVLVSVLLGKLVSDMRRGEWFRAFLDEVAGDG